MHYRRVIREALKALLVSAGTRAGDNVFTGRARPILEILRKRESVISIYTGDETSERSQDGQVYERSLTVSVEVALGGGDDLDDLLDDFALEVEAAINRDPSLGNVLSSDLSLRSTVSEISAAGQFMVGAARLDFDATYYTGAAIADQFPMYPVPDDFDPATVRPETAGNVRSYADERMPLPGPDVPHLPLPGVLLAPGGWAPAPLLTDPGEPFDPAKLVMVVNGYSVNLEDEPA